MPQVGGTASGKRERTNANGHKRRCRPPMQVRHDHAPDLRCLRLVGRGAGLDLPSNLRQVTVLLDMKPQLAALGVLTSAGDASAVLAMPRLNWQTTGATAADLPPSVIAHRVVRFRSGDKLMTNDQGLDHRVR